MANKEEKPEGVKDSSWKEFIYNPRTGEFLGRTASSWGKKTSSKCGAPSFLPQGCLRYSAVFTQTPAISQNSLLLIENISQGYIRVVYILTCTAHSSTNDRSVLSFLHHDAGSCRGLGFTAEALHILFDPAAFFYTEPEAWRKVCCVFIFMFSASFEPTPCTDEAYSCHFNNKHTGGINCLSID